MPVGVSTKELESICREHGETDQTKGKTSPSFMYDESPNRSRDHEDHQHQGQHGGASPRDDEQGYHGGRKQVRGPIPLDDGSDRARDHHGRRIWQGAKELNSVHVEHDRGKARVQGRKDFVECGMIEG